MNYGVRWEPFFPQINNDGTSLHFDEAGLRKGIKTNRLITLRRACFSMETRASETAPA